MEILLFILFGAYMTYQIYKWKRRPMNPEKTKVANPNTSNTTAPKNLSKTQVKRITVIQQALIEVNNTSLEETLNNFSMDLNPDSEIAIWEAIAGAYQQVLQQRPTASAEEKHEVYRLLLLRSNMPAEEAIAQAGLSVLSEADARAVLQHYDLGHKPILVVKP